MTTLFVIQFATLLWAAALSLGLALVAVHTRATRRAVLAAFRGDPNTLRLPPRPLPASALEVAHGNAVPAPPSGLSAARVRGPDDVVAPPPTVRGDTVRDWLRHYTNHEHAWNGVVAEFYRRAASYPAVASYFAGVDMPRLQRHFVAALVVVTSNGLTARTVRAMTVAHAPVRNRDGVPITGAVYDQVVDVLVEVLVEHGVPGPAIDELARVIDPLRAAIVAAE